MLAADQVELIVLAPASYYAPYRLGTLAAALDAQVSALGRAHSVELSFRYEILPDELAPDELAPDELALVPLPPDSIIPALLDQRRPL